jgi:hypothetical protein
MSQDLELGIGDAQGLLLQGKRQAVRNEEPDEMTRRADRQVTELEGLGGPRRERLLPGQVQQACSAIAQP